MLLRIIKVITDELVKTLDNKAPTETNENPQETVISANPFSVGNRNASQGDPVNEVTVSLFKQKISSFNDPSTNENETWSPEYTPVSLFRKRKLNVNPPESAQQ